jgi:peptidoglycan LD-endopeptidase CwlK
MPDRTPKPAELQHIERSVPELRAPALKVLTRLREASVDRPWMVYVTDGPRSQAKQWEKYKVGRRQRPDGTWERIGRTVSDARPDLSYHCRAAAVDFALILKGVDVNGDGYDDWLPDAHEDWNLIGEYAKAEGFEWGGDFKRKVTRDGKTLFLPNPDKPHIQLPGALTRYPLLP